MLLHRTACRFSAKYKAAETLKRNMQRFSKRMKAKREQSAVTIQNAARGKSAYKKVSSLRDAERLRVEQRRLDEENSRLQSLKADEMDKAASLIGKMARDRCAIKEAKGHRDNLLSAKIQKEREVQAMKDKLHSDAKAAGDKLNKENGAALLIQAASRGR